jgi:hypothetical protein
MRAMSTFASLAFVFVTACGTDDSGPPEPTARATWYQDVAPLLANHCMSCHQDGGIGPFALTDYDSARENGERMLVQTDKAAMPPFDAREEADCTPRFSWVDDPRLSEHDKATLHAWVEDGYALGTEAAIPPIPTTNLQGVSKTLTPVEGFAAQGDQDQFECFLFDPGNKAQLAFLTGMQINPDVKEVVHHAVIAEIPSGTDQQALVDAHGIGKPFKCDQLGTAPGTFTVYVWTPGNDPFETSSEIAVPVFPNALFLMNVHYHPAGGVHAPDKTSIDMRFSTTVPKALYLVQGFGNAFQAPQLLPDPDDTGAPAFVIPPNMPDHREHMRFTVPDLKGRTDIKLFSVNPHMHLIGTHVNGTIERPTARGNDPQTECLANGAWNFDWQRTYQYDAPLANLPGIQAGDTIDIKCAWDNTLNNPFVTRMLKDSGLGASPVEVKLGEQTTNEMCLEIFGLAVPVASARVNAETLQALMPNMPGNALDQLTP